MLVIIKFFFLQRILAESNYKLQKIFITKGETVPLPLQSLIIPINELQEIQNVKYIKQNITLYSEVKRFKQDRGFGSEMYVLFSNNYQTLELCFQEQYSIRCDYEIKNFIKDDQLIIEKIESNSISLQQQDCQNLHQIDSSYYIIQCALNQTNYLFQIINNKGEVFDSIEFQIRKQCQGVSKYAYQRLLFFEKMCQCPTLFLIQVDVSELIFIGQLQTIVLNDQNLDRDSMNQQLLDANYCIQNLIKINLEYFVIYYELDSFLIKIERIYKNKIYGFYEKCNEQLRIIFKGNITTSFDLAVDTELEKMQLGFVVNKNLILLIENKITIFNNQYYNQTLPGQYKKILALYKLPYIVCQSSEGDLIFYQINQYQTWYHYMQSTYLAIYQKRICELTEIPEVVIQTELYDLNNPKLMIIHNQTVLDSSWYQTFIEFSIKKISFGLPANIGSFNNQNSLVALVQQLQVSNCSIHNNARLQRLFFLEKNTPGLIFVDNQNTLKTMDCLTQSVYLIPLNTTSKILNIILLTQNFKFLIQTKDTLYYVVIQQNFQISHHQIFYQPDLKFKISFNGYMITILQENCTTVNLIPEVNNSQIFHSQYLYENCTSTFEFFNKNLFINDSLIIYNNTEQVYSQKSKNTIVLANLAGKYLLVSTILESILKIKIYFLEKIILYLYELPTYNYKIFQPIQYQLLQKTQYFIIAAQDQSGNEALLVYDISKQASQCLQNVIPFDKGIYEFGFITYNQRINVWYVLDKQIMLYNLINTDIYLDSQFKSDKYYSQYEVDLLIESIIPSISQAHKLIINYYNFDSNLRFKLNVTEKTIDIDTRDNFLTLNNIYGSIASITSQSKYFIIQPPVLTLNNKFNCQYFSLGFCYINQTLYFYHSDYQRIVFESNLISEIYYIEMIAVNEFNIFYVDTKHQLILLKYCNNEIRSINQIQQFQYHLQQSIESIEKNMISFQINKKKMFFFFHRQTLMLWPLDLDEIQCLLIVPLGQNIFIFVFQDDKEQILFQKQAFFGFGANRIQFEQIGQDFYLQTSIIFKNLMILHYNVIEGKLIIEFLTAANQKLNWYIYKVVIDIANNEILEHFTSNYIRFGESYHFVNPLIYNDQFIILKIKNNNKNTNLFFDISMRNQFEILDSIYEFNTSISDIKQYNSTHYAAITVQQDYSIVELILIDKYRIKCNQQCKNSTYEIMLKNENSLLILNASYIYFGKDNNIDNQNEKSTFTIKKTIIIVDLLVILFVCLFQKFKRSSRVFYNLN